MTKEQAKKTDKKENESPEFKEELSEEELEGVSGWDTDVPSPPGLHTRFQYLKEIILATQTYSASRINWIENITDKATELTEEELKGVDSAGQVTLLALLVIFGECLIALTELPWPVSTKFLYGQ